MQKGTWGIFAAVFLLLGCGMTARAQEAGVYGFLQTPDGVMWQNADGSLAKDCWVGVGEKIWHLDPNGYVQVGLTEADGDFYYLTPEGILTTGWLTIGDGIYFFDADGKMAKNTQIEGFVIGPDGRVSGVSALAQLVSRTVASVTTPEMTGAQKLRACYEYVLDFTSYQRSYETPSGDWVGPYAAELLTTGKGNCYRYAAAFACLAKGIGYEARVATGQIKAARGGVTPHGWTEVKIDGEWYLFDPDMEDAKKWDFYKKTYDGYPVKPLEKQAEWAVVF